MTVVAVPTYAPRGDRLAVLALLLALFLGLLSFAAVGEMTVKCEQGYALLDGGGYALLNSGERVALNGRQCYIAAGDIRLALPAWLPAMFR
jgi:hypothetical protein